MSIKSPVPGLANSLFKMYLAPVWIGSTNKAMMKTKLKLRIPLIK